MLAKCNFAGRRSTSIFWSPEKIRDSLTPIRTAMTLRSSPRKRLLLTDITPIVPEQSQHTVSPRKPNTNQIKQAPPGGKRLKFDEKPIAQTNTHVPLTDTLKGKNICQQNSIERNFDDLPQDFPTIN